ncbi:MAG: hypothetical protein P0Y53_23355 [Candidatus Pseudobacter hemicellulosilyticus]|uniref:Uncharacterized protein n=1 Tax=Candidatus Pseudobacter hemicellulosilyticus TaxID=3121375 RepID=A0AAJ5WRI3_9BACT|nr:MAG: hypothetical protein P0Y53_23355 [Pseudobacter sp.]
MKHLRSRLFWSLVVLGIIIWTIDHLFITRPGPLLMELPFYLVETLITAFILDVFLRKTMPGSTSWFNNPIDKKQVDTNTSSV